MSKRANNFEEPLNCNWGLIKREVLVNSIIDSMIEYKVITPEQWKHLKSLQIPEAERTEEFLHLLLESTTVNKFVYFTKALCGSGHDYIANKLGCPAQNDSDKNVSSSSNAMPSSHDGQVDLRIFNSLLEKMSSMEKKIDVSKEQGEEMMKKMNAQTNLLNEIKEDKLNDTKRHDDTQEQIRVLELQVQATTTDLQNIREQTKKNEEKKMNELSVLGEKMNCLKKEKEALQKQLEKKDEEIHLLQVRYEIKSNECDYRGRTMKQLLNEKTKLLHARADDDIMTLQNEIKENETERKMLTDQIQSLEASIQKLEKQHHKEMEKMMASLAKSKNECNNLKKELVRKSKEIEMLNNFNSKLKQIRQRPKAASTVRRGGSDLKHGDKWKISTVPKTG